MLGHTALRTIAAAAICERRLAEARDDHGKVKALPRGAFGQERRTGADRRSR